MIKKLLAFIESDDRGVRSIKFLTPNFKKSVTYSTDSDPITNGGWKWDSGRYSVSCDALVADHSRYNYMRIQKIVSVDKIGAYNVWLTVNCYFDEKITGFNS